MQVAISGLKGLLTPPFRTALQQSRSPLLRAEKSQHISCNCSCVGAEVADRQSLVKRTRSSAKDSSHLTMQACTGRDEVWSIQKSLLCLVVFSFAVVMWAALKELHLI